MYNKRVIPSGRRGATPILTAGDKADLVTAAGAADLDVEARLVALENPTEMGARATIGAHVGTPNQLGTPQRSIRFNCEFEVTAEPAIISLIIEGVAYIDSDAISLRYSGLRTAAAFLLGNAVDLVGGTRPMGVGVSPNGNPYVWFEAHNHITTFTVEALRCASGGIVTQDTLNVHLTEAGTAWV